MDNRPDSARRGEAEVRQRNDRIRNQRAEIKALRQTIAAMEAERDEALQHVEDEQKQAVIDATEQSETIRENMRLKAEVERLRDDDTPPNFDLTPTR